MDWKDELKKVKIEQTPIANPAADASSANLSAGSTSAIPVTGVYNHITGITNPANAPYNFVPLNNIVVLAECKPEDDFTSNKYHEGRYTGYIKLDIKTETPLYIRDTLTKEEMKEKDAIEKNNKKRKYINPDFFSPADKICIPGSSLRGMTRTLIEIMSYSRMQFIDHKEKYHFRSFVDKSIDLRKAYTSRMMTGDDTTGHYQQVKAGYLSKVGVTSYKIKPAKEVSRGSDLQYARVEGTLVARLLGCPFSYKKVKFICDPPAVDRNHSKPLYYSKVTAISNDSENRLNNPQIGYLIQSGNMPNKHMHWVIAEVNSSATPLEFTDGVIENYKNDTNRNVGEGAELMRQCKDGSDVPCFYIEENNKVISFGHTGLFRLTYMKSIEGFLPQSHCNHDSLDIAESIFGNEETFAGRVFFEDAYPNEDKNNVQPKESVPKILSTPKPTTFQHYLVQHQPITHQNHPEDGYLGLQNYNDETCLRGNKLYWHKTGDNWEEEKLTFWQNDFNSILRSNNLTRTQFDGHITQRNNKITVSFATLPPNLKESIVKAVGKYETQHTRIKPIDRNKTFTGRIRFENLSKVELGALLSALDLPVDCCHKLGMGKPLGLGSVKITPTLHLSDRKTRYTDISAEWNKDIPESTKDDETIQNFKNDFEKYVLDKLEEKEETSLWEIKRMKELERMLNFEKKPADEDTRYMTITPKNEFKERKVLPKPTEVGKRDLICDKY